MNFARPTIQELIARNIADIESTLPGSNAAQTGSNLNVLATVQAGAMHGAYGALEVQAHNLMADTCDDEHLVRKASFHGLTKITATKASGTAIFTGTDGTIIPAGTITQFNSMQWQTTSETRIIGDTAIVAVEALEAGSDGNITSVKLQLASPIAGIDASGITANTITSGSDEETTESLRARFLAYLRQPPRGGAYYDYEHWAKEASSDVTRAYAYPNEIEPGTVTVRIINDNDGMIAGDALIEAVHNYIASVAPAGKDKIFVVAPILKPIDFVITLNSVDTQAVRDEVSANLSDILAQKKPGAGVLISHVREAISIAVGEYDHTLHAPTDNINASTGELITLGNITWSAS